MQEGRLLLPEEAGVFQRATGGPFGRSFGAYAILIVRVCFETERPHRLDGAPSQGMQGVSCSLLAVETVAIV